MPSGVYKRRIPPWHKGLTKQTDDRLVRLGQSVSKALTGKPKTEEHIQGMILARKRMWLNPEFRNKREKTMRNIYCSLEYRKKVSDGLTRAHSDTTKYQILQLQKPLDCYHCNNLIIVRGVTREGLVFHSLDGNHNNWSPENKVPVHRKCHPKVHSKPTLYGGAERGEGETNTMAKKLTEEEMKYRGTIFVIWRKQLQKGYWYKLRIIGTVEGRKNAYISQKSGKNKSELVSCAKRFVDQFKK